MNELELMSTHIDAHNFRIFHIVSMVTKKEYMRYSQKKTRRGSKYITTKIIKRKVSKGKSERQKHDI
jgi:hypothetical protein